MASPPSSPHEEPAGVAAICCMCGDHGLPRELFRCRACRVRLQHRYCSDLYPRATAYRRCNWCLRDPPAQAQGGGAAGHAAAAVANNGKPPAESKRKAAAATATATIASDEERQRHEGCSPRRPPAELGCPVKKRRKADETAQDDDTGKGRCHAAGESKELMRAGKAPRVRVKVQRYKLLAEVISC